MNWTHFLLWLTAIYSLYYITLILLDLTSGKRKAAAVRTSELTFSEQVSPVRLGTDAEPQQDLKKKHSTPKPAEVISSGGVPITDLFRLAKQEAIIYTRSVSF
jgi:hypothetical protein